MAEITSAKAMARTVRVSPRKTRLVLDLIRGKNVADAIAILKFTPNKAARIVEKTLNSAIANAENNFGLEKANLVVSETFANEGPTMKRFRPRAKGSASPINKRTTHVTVVVSEKLGGILVGQKVHPIGMRVGIIRDWDAKWYAEKEYADYLHEDLAIRKFIQKELADASVSTIEIVRAVNKVIVSLHTAKPGMVIGKGGSNVDALRAQLNKLTGKQVHINIVEIKKPDLDAHLVGETIARQLEQRVAFRRAQKQAIQRAMRAGAKGIKTQVSGRLNGADIARAEGYSEGTVPLHTLRADIDYAWEEADTTYGKLGVKVWIYRGEVLPARKNTKGGK